MNEVVFVQSNLAPVAESSSLTATQPAAGVLLSEYRFHGCGIYGIENAKTRVVYVGQTKDFWVRIRTELADLRAGEHHCKHLQRSFNKHGESFFRLHVLELCEEKELNARELHWIHEKKTTVGVYNSKTSSDCGRFWTTTQEFADLQSKNKKELWALPLFAHYHQKKMWSDERKARARCEYFNRTVCQISAIHREVCDISGVKNLLEEWISNGLSTPQIQIKLGFYKRKLYMLYNALGIDKRKLYQDWCNKVLSLKRSEVKPLCEKYGARIGAAYQIRSRHKKPAPISESGLNDSRPLTL